MQLSVTKLSEVDATSLTLASGARQFVVQEALDIT